MLEQQKTFGEALAEWMRASGVSTKRLAERTGYKSKTSIVPHPSGRGRPRRPGAAP